MLRSAHALAELHDRRSTSRDPLFVAEIDRRRSELIDDIDEWVERELPAAAIGADSIGVVVDRMARAWVQANLAIDREGARSDNTHKHWYHLAELVDGYTDLVSAVADGRRRS
ncbi:DUF4254 domain-containing protein [Nocardia stercoris]|uniref:DUF4254 domain-containing protein n=1 Tax=Nocardia stercoris TaxID=2483361 RepID=A0A3M2LH41_9NOCA|nr:DUF4254 domain-containing protein [Nocardia stercoris]